MKQSPEKLWEHVLYRIVLRSRKNLETASKTFFLFTPWTENGSQLWLVEYKLVFRWKSSLPNSQK